MDEMNGRWKRSSFGALLTEVERRSQLLKGGLTRNVLN